ncbi:MAG TPA: hypothetical protein VHZ95_06760, partial [Polyangiales bacterium]|nr:hypothetical protein [Polyangiales bacterium]
MARVWTTRAFSLSSLRVFVSAGLLIATSARAQAPATEPDAAVHPALPPPSAADAMAPSPEAPLPPSAAEESPPPSAADESLPPSAATGGSAPSPDQPLPIPDAEPLGDETSAPAVDEPSSNAPIRYALESIRVKGNRTRGEIIAGFVPFKPGEHFDVDDPALESVRWRLLGTGWFDDVKLSLSRGSRR